ncbi:hypothetical protein KC842_02185 [Candidatus Nomurabacteria bacterium]|nr:hypothetical protein [Candidatus Nomurabacteria bacterium]USN94977.1 MAG: hypothetical protein H6791_00925 [Candidatus Nomurabacteria bacterium]
MNKQLLLLEARARDPDFDFKVVYRKRGSLSLFNLEIRETNVSFYYLMDKERNWIIHPEATYRPQKTYTIIVKEYGVKKVSQIGEYSPEKVLRFWKDLRLVASDFTLLIKTMGFHQVSRETAAKILFLKKRKKRLKKIAKRINNLLPPW